MTFEQANRWANANSYGKNDKAKEAFGIKYYSSICESCDHKDDCFFYIGNFVWRNNVYRVCTIRFFHPLFCSFFFAATCKKDEY